MSFGDLDEEVEQESMQVGDWKRWFKNPYFLIAIILIGLCIILRGRIGVKTIDKAYYWTGMAYILFLLGTAGDMALKHFSAKSIWGNGFSNISKTPLLPCGDWTGVRLDGYSKGFDLNTNSGILFAPTDTVFRAGHSVHIAVNAREVDKEELPPHCKAVVDDMKLNPPYLKGLIDIDLYKQLSERSKETAGAKIKYIEDMYDQQCRTTNELLTMLNKKFKNYEQVTKFINRMSKRMKEKTSWKDMIFEKEKKEE